MANQYIFFDQALAARFVAIAAELGITGQTYPDPIEGVVVDLPDALPDDQLDILEARYDALMDEQRALIDAEEGAGAGVVMGVSITLPNGEPCLVSLPAPLGRRLAEHFTPDEIHEIVETVAANVVTPLTAPLCCRV